MRLFARIRGIEKEVKKLHQKGLSWKRMEELGLEYRYMARLLRQRGQTRYLRSSIIYDTTVTKLEKEIWHYAKRQMTWFKRNKEIQWFLPSQKQKIFTLVRKFLFR